MNKMIKITTRLSKNNQVARAFAMGAPGCEAGVLERVAEASIRGEVVPPELQKIANAILGVVLLTGKLPEKAPGRPKDEMFALKGVERAYRFFELVDKKVCSREEALRLVAKQLPASSRHVERSIEDYGWLIGGKRDDDFDARRRFRLWRAGMSIDDYREAVLLELRFHDGLGPVKQRPLKELLASAPNRVTAIQVELRRLVDLATGRSPESGQLKAPDKES
jgi:hypothetical protein